MSRSKRPDPLAAMSAPAAALTRAVLAAADAEGVSVLLVGGPVRDLLLGREIVDVDLLVDDEAPGRAAALAERVAGEGLKSTVHPRFGTATVRQDDAHVDLATVRSERYAHPGALPTVEAGTLDEDLARRDFSVNALAMPLSKKARAAHPAVVDRLGGLADLEERRLRVLHDRSFHDDPTRALRAARLAPRLGFSLARGSRRALRDALRDGAFARVSGDRLRRECVRVFEDASRGLDPTRALHALDDWHVLGALEPGLRLEGAARLPLRRLGRAIAEPPWKAPRWRPWMTGFGVWLGPLPAALRRRALRRFGLRGAPAKRVGEIPRQVERSLRGLAKARGRGAVDAVLTGLGEEELYAVYVAAESALRRRIARFAAEDRSRRLPVTGADLLAAGLSGPAIGRALERIRVAWLDGAVRTREEALALAQEVAKRTRAKR